MPFVLPARVCLSAGVRCAVKSSVRPCRATLSRVSKFNNSLAVRHLAWQVLGVRGGALRGVPVRVHDAPRVCHPQGTVRYGTNTG